MKYLIITYIDRKDLARIFSKVEFDKTSGCWNWTASTARGYGKVSWKGKLNSVHRVMYAWLVGPLPHYTPGGLELDHLCRNKKCCNPAHLELVAPSINIRRSESVCGINARKTHCKRGHELSGDNLRPDMYGRECRTCLNARARRYRAEKKIVITGT